MTRLRTLFPIILILCIAWAMLVIRIGAPWVGHQDANGAWISSAIHNYERYSFIALGGMIVLNNGLVESDEYEYYTSHPPLPIWLPTIAVLLVGYDEAVVRFVFAACTLLGIATLYALVRHLFGRIPALWSAAFYAFTPMTVYFGRMPDHEAPAILLLLLFVRVLVLYLEQPTRNRWWILAVLIFTEAWTAWGGLICIFAICAVGWWAGGRVQRYAIFRLMLIGTTGAVLVFAFYQLQWTGTLESFIQRFLWRTSNQSFTEGSELFTVGQYIGRVLTRCLTLFTPTICVIALFGIAPLIRDRSKVKRTVPFALALGGLGFMLLFRNASYVHDYYLIYLTPAVAIFAGVGLWFRWQHNSSRWTRPILFSMIIMTPPALWRYTEWLYQGSMQTNPLLVAHSIEHQTDTNDLIMSNLPSVGHAIEFYASRDILWGIPPIEVVAQSNMREGVVYFHCGESGALSPEVTLLSNDEILTGCYLSRLS